MVTTAMVVPLPRPWAHAAHPKGRPRSSRRTCILGSSPAAGRLGAWCPGADLPRFAHKDAGVRGTEDRPPWWAREVIRTDRMLTSV